ncbi:conserved hypothetical protein [Leishmania infantum JPCM5]|uniref:Uncharacterized protein n=2 Tax=Leishmania infantum TaxID=5671 RepID=E9AHV9_LEIIN|nr:conserved hypothetical protein [Leishmania infantum JPCM5]CAC9544650.1 hypothetical_protein_-_conserved [Leishmania infantum]CBZ09013.1 conserved hypothetical protein [Leishmania infantum JPCM5]SUZ46047.1 hypothetical_protein_-_conserved [Leishmania infantum]|eukprot:XP_003392810.1 conserved hypothetical protein [Leishmania infantum JPCM5]
MPPPASTAQAGTGRDAPLAESPPPNSTTLTIPHVNIPLLPPGYPLPASTDDMEASTAVYFREGRNPYGKRHRSTLVNEPSASASSTVLEIVSAEEDVRAAVDGTDRGRFAGSAPQSQSTAAGYAVTAQYLAQLFDEPARCEQDVYRPVDVAYCRRLLAQEAEEFKMAASSQPPTGSSLEGTEAAIARAKRVHEFNSCLTAGQHRRYRGFVLEWLRHQPSPAAPPNSAEVLKVVQQEQQLFLEALRREALCHVVRLSSGHQTTTYACLGRALTSFAQYRRLHQMQERLVSFLDDAKAKESKGLLLSGSAPAASSSAASGAAEEDAHNRDAAHSPAGDLQQGMPHGATPLQVFQRRFPSLRVLQWHLVKLYNAQQNGVAAPFPNLQVRSFAAPSGVAAGGRPHNRHSESDGTFKASSFSAAAAHPSAVTMVPASASLSLASLPQHRQDDDGDQPGARDGGRVSDDGDSERSASPAVPAFSSHLSTDAAAAASLTPLSTAALHTYVAHHLLPRLGWQASKYQGKDGEAGIDDEGTTAVVASVSLSMTFEAMLKLFVAHVDTEEPRTSFRIPICVHVRRNPDSRHTDNTTSARGVYHAHVAVGAAVPNVTESRQSIQLAAAEYLLCQAANREGSRGEAATPSEARHLPSTPTAAETAPLAAATVHLLRSTAMPQDTKTRQATVQSMTGGAGGNPINASVENLLEQQEPASDTVLPLVFRVAAPVAAAVSTAHGNDPLQRVSPVVIMAKMEHLNATSAVAPHARSPSLAASPSTVDSECVVASLTETATPCRWLLEMLSPREMLQLDLLFACFPSATVHLHRVQLSQKSDRDEPVEPRGACEEEECLSMDVLAVEQLTSHKWGLSRRHLQKRPAESLITTPSPAEVLATYTWDLLYDTLAWLLDTTARRVAYALESEEGRGEGSAEITTNATEERYMYLILSNHANLVNTSASTKLCTKKRPENAPEPAYATVITSSYTESRFAVRYIVQDAAEIYPNYEPKVPIAFEVANLRFLEKDTQSGSDEDGEGDIKPTREKKSVSKVASRLYRDPHTWNAETIPFTFPRAPAPALAPT